MLYLEDRKELIKRGIIGLLRIKDTDIRLTNLYQCRHAVDKAIHIGGASSCVIPMVSLYFGGVIRIDIENPTSSGQDLFVLSKGHAVATLASIYSKLGYFDPSVLKNSRSVSSILNGHPGPLLPGVHLATGPMGQGIGVAQGLAIAGQHSPLFDVFALTGDGELQEGPVWESIMFAGYKKLENLCVLVDANGGQLDTTASLHFPYNSLAGSFESFGWNAVEVDATQYHMVYAALQEFKHGERNGKPTAVICKTTKGFGGISSFMNSHKATIPDSVLDQEDELQSRARNLREKDFFSFFNRLSEEEYSYEKQKILSHAQSIGYKIEKERITEIEPSVRTAKAPVRNKKIIYDESRLPQLEIGKSYAADEVIRSCMKVFALDKRICSVDADLASTSGLQGGVGFVDKRRALNVGVAEANMMLIGEAFAILGGNVWISTFCPFFDWKVMRRIAVGQQERLEVIAQKDGWLSEGHGLDLTMVATAADLETQSNGATHMGNDDLMVFDEMAQIKIINVSCPQQLIGVMKWIADGNRGLVYIRLLRKQAPVIYKSDFHFEFGNSYNLTNFIDATASIVTSGRGVHEALGAVKELSDHGVTVDVIDMPSVDEAAIIQLHQEGKPVFIAEQNNGFLFSNFRRVLFKNESVIQTQNLIAINTSSREGKHYIHSGTYAELAASFGLNAAQLSETILNFLTTKS